MALHKAIEWRRSHQAAQPPSNKALRILRFALHLPHGWGRLGKQGRITTHYPPLVPP